MMLGGLVVGVPSLRVKLYRRSPRSPRPSSRTSSSPTGHPGGTPAAPPARLFGVDLDTSFRIYLIVPLTALMVLGAANLFRTRIGCAFIAIRDRDISAELHPAAALSCCPSRPVLVHAGGRRSVGLLLPRGHAGELSADHVDLPAAVIVGRHGIDPAPSCGLHDHGARDARWGGWLPVGGEMAGPWLAAALAVAPAARPRRPVLGGSIPLSGVFASPAGASTPASPTM